jgi:hypothetical protein
MSDRQYGFTPQKSTEQALHSLTNFIEQAFEQKGFALVIAVDIVGAFDNTWWPKILHQLRRKSCPKNLYEMAKSYFNNRLAKLWYLNEEVSRQINMGCPKGSACCPHFWKIYYDDLLEIQLDDNQFIESFADDTCIGIRAKYGIRAQRKLCFRKSVQMGRNK